MLKIYNIKNANCSTRTVLLCKAWYCTRGRACNVHASQGEVTKNHEIPGSFLYVVSATISTFDARIKRAVITRRRQYQQAHPGFNLSS